MKPYPKRAVILFSNGMKLIGKKLNMTQVWKNDKVVPVTVIKLESEIKKEKWEELKEGMKMKVSGTSKGKGFQGVVKRHGFHGGPNTHGQKNRLRAPGSIGSTAPQRVIKGRKMAGHMGNVRVTIKNLKIVEIKPEEKILMLRGAVPGMRGAKVELTITNNQ